MKRAFFQLRMSRGVTCWSFRDPPVLFFPCVTGHAPDLLPAAKSSALILRRRPRHARICEDTNSSPVKKGRMEFSIMSFALENASSPTALKKENT